MSKRNEVFEFFDGLNDRIDEIIDVGNQGTTPEHNPLSAEALSILALHTGDYTLASRYGLFS